MHLLVRDRVDPGKVRDLHVNLRIFSAWPPRSQWCRTASRAARSPRPDLPVLQPTDSVPAAGCADIGCKVFVQCRSLPACYHHKKPAGRYPRCHRHRSAYRKPPSGQIPYSGLFADISQDTAIHIQDVAVHKVAGFGSQEHCRTLQILRRSPAGCRCLGNNELVKRMPAAVRLFFPSG